MKNSLSKEDIKQLLPHREPMLLIDELIDINGLLSATAIVNVRKDSFFVQGHFPDNPVMPGVLIVEALAQAAAILSFKTGNFMPSDDSVYYFAGIDKARFKKPVSPGDQLILEVSIDRILKGIWKYNCSASVDGKLVAEADIMCILKDIKK